MSVEKLCELINRYREYFKSIGVEKVELSDDMKGFMDDKVLAHCNSILDGLEKVLEEGNRESVFGYMRFIQGCLFANGFFSLKELNEHNS